METNPQEYKELCQLVSTQVESCIMQVMDIVLEVYGVTNEQLQYAITEYIKDPNKVEQLRMQKMQGKSAH